MIKIEEMTVNELKAQAVSSITKAALAKRTGEGLSEITLGNCTLDKNKKFLEAVFYAQSTFENESYIDSANIDFDTPEKNYTLVLRWYDVLNVIPADEIGDIDVLEYSKIENILSNIINKCNVRMYADDPSFYWQGVHEGLDKNGLSIYKFVGENGKGIWHDRHAASGGLTNREIHLTKHLAQLMETLDDYIRPMAQKLEVRG